MDLKKYEFRAGEILSEDPSVLVTKSLDLDLVLRTYKVEGEN